MKKKQEKKDIRYCPKCKKKALYEGVYAKESKANPYTNEPEKYYAFGCGHCGTSWKEQTIGQEFNF